VTVVFAGRGTDPAPVAGRQLAVSVESPELGSSLAFRFPASRWDVPLSLPDVVLLLPADTVETFFLRDVVSFTCKVERALIKGNSFQIPLGSIRNLSSTDETGHVSECLSAKPSQAKGLTGGGDLCEAQVDVPLSVIHSCV